MLIPPDTSNSPMKLAGNTLGFPWWILVFLLQEGLHQIRCTLKSSWSRHPAGRHRAQAQPSTREKIPEALFCALDSCPNIPNWLRRRKWPTGTTRSRRQPSADSPVHTAFAQHFPSPLCSFERCWHVEQGFKVLCQGSFQFGKFN